MKDILLNSNNKEGSSNLTKVRSNLPYDYEVEYLQSTGSQYIDTGVVPTNKTRVIDIVNISSGRSGWGSSGHKETFLWGTWVSDNITDYLISRSVNWTLYHFDEIPFDNNTHRFEISPEILKVDDEAYTSATSYTKRLDKTLYLFATNVEWIPYIEFETSKRVNTQIFENNTIIRDYIPVVKNNIGYLYDKVNDQLYGNAGTGSFIIGPRKSDITKPWTQGSGNLYAAFNGQGNGTIEVWSDPNDLSQPRSMTLDVHTLDDTKHESLLVRQLSA